MYKQPLEYNKHYNITFRAFVQENNDKNPINSIVLWEIDGVYLQSLDKIQGVQEILYIHNHRVITRKEIF